MEQDIIKNIKKSFFAYRNGVITDRLRNAGDCHKVIFGLNIPQLVEIANATGQNANIARQLWFNSDSRESRLIAPMIFPSEDMSIEEAHSWIDSVENTEVSDNLCHKLLKKLPYTETLFQEYSLSANDLLRYTAFRIAMNLLCSGYIRNYNTLQEQAKLELSKNCQLTKLLCTNILDEIEWAQTNESRF